MANVRERHDRAFKSYQVFLQIWLTYPTNTAASVYHFIHYFHFIFICELYSLNLVDVYDIIVLKLYSKLNNLGLKGFYRCLLVVVFTPFYKHKLEYYISQMLCLFLVLKSSLQF